MFLDHWIQRDLSENELEGEIPDTVGNLHFLEIWYEDNGVYIKITVVYGDD